MCGLSTYFGAHLAMERSLERGLRACDNIFFYTQVTHIVSRCRGFRAENVPFAAYTPEPVRKRPLKEGDATLALAQFPFLQDNKLPTYSKQSLRSLRATTNRSLSI
ncbi:hypothetical protein PC121_g9395 [Phytophthora cactorum]|nr:hypothetical protein PC121_g9395 [Phytophthora cactorum]